MNMVWSDELVVYFALGWVMGSLGTGTGVLGT